MPATSLLLFCLLLDILGLRYCTPVLYTVCVCVCLCTCAPVPCCSIMSDSSRPNGLYSPPGPSVHGSLQARTLEWIAMPFSKGSPRPRDRALGLLPCSRIFYHPSHLGSAALRCTAQHTKAQPLVEGACTWQCAPDTWTDLRDWTREYPFASLKVHNLRAPM